MDSASRVCGFSRRVHPLALVAAPRRPSRGHRIQARRISSMDRSRTAWLRAANLHQLSSRRGRHQPFPSHPDDVSNRRSILCSWNSIGKRVKEFFVMLLMLEVGVVGVFLSLDLFLFFLFWEVMLIPMYFLIGIWGHERRIYAAIKFVLYTMAGSILMLVGILWLY